MLISIIIPAFNESDTISRIISIVKKAKLPKGLDREIIVVDDGSTDNTYQILKKISGIKILRHPQNQGKGRAMATGFAAARGDIILTQDADLEYDPKFYLALLKPILKGQAKVVYGSRFLYVLQRQKNISFLKKTHKASYYLAYLGGRVITGVANFLYGIHITDEATGYKVLTREVLILILLESKHFEFCPEITAKVSRLGYQIQEVPISYEPRTYEQGKKIHWQDGLEGLWTLLKYRFSRLHYPRSTSAKTNRNLEDVVCNICGAADFDVVYPELPGLAALNPKEVFSSSSHNISVEQIVKCRRCGLVYVTPRFKPTVVVAGYSGAVDKDYVSQEQARLATFQKSLQLLAQYASQPEKLLDVGAAAGYFVKAASDAGWIAEGVEPSRWMSEYASSRLNVKVLPGTIHDHHYVKNSFNAVTFWDVLEHVPDPSADLFAAARILKYGGILIVNYPDFASLPAKIFGRKWWFVLSIHLFYFTPDTITKMLNKHGFNILKIKPHFQTLELGYLIYRLKSYSGLGYKIMMPIAKLLHLDKLHLPYYAGQTLVIAQKRYE